MTKKIEKNDKEKSWKKQTKKIEKKLFLYFFSTFLFSVLGIE